MIKRLLALFFSSIVGKKKGYDKQGNIFFCSRFSLRRWVIPSKSYYKYHLEPNWYGWLHGFLSWEECQKMGKLNKNSKVLEKSLSFKKKQIIIKEKNIWRPE